MSIEVPEHLIPALESCARQRHSSVQEVAVAAIEHEVSSRNGVALNGTGHAGHRVRLPLVCSAEPRSLRSLTSGEIDELLDQTA